MGQTVGRFAPTPSGYLHLGNLFSSLLAWLSAKSQGGRIILRNEDLDPDRSRPEFVLQAQRDLELLGLTWDEGGDLKILVPPFICGLLILYEPVNC